uniref:glycoside hydrolase family 97 protein n=1 Tax=uncultured Draconibacterium sp. TaxID=1573823 RepID=UPI0032173090
MKLKDFFLVAAACCLTSISCFAKENRLKSPDGKLEVTIDVQDKVSYSIQLNGDVILAPSAIAMSLSEGVELGKSAQIRNVETSSVSTIIEPVVKRKFEQIQDNYNELTIQFKGDYNLIFRAYNDGIAYRWKLNRTGNYKVISEDVNFCFTANNKVWFPEESSMYSHQERGYSVEKLANITTDRFGSTGMLVELPGGAKMYISESDLESYPGMFLQGTETPNMLKGKFAGFPLETKQTSDRDVKVTKYANYLAEIKAPRAFPWRVMIIAGEDKQLITSELIYQLASPNRIGKTNWIKIGKVAWDWWNANNIYGVDFESGINTKTYKYYIDFASKYNLKYIILDEGWYHLEDVLKVNDAINIKELVAYGKKKNVDVILWVTWKALYDKLDQALTTFNKWGVKGIKVDFMQRDDQWMVDYYYLVAQKAADQKLLVDYHGSYKPTGISRTFPNVITSEGVRGLENCKWSDVVTPEHNVTLPFIRMVAGPMDYTPGAMLNARKDNFKAIFTEPMSSTTRCHQLAMYVVYESPLQMLADNPSNYYREPECMKFLSQVPTEWDDTKVLAAKVSDYIAVARKAGNRWYIGAMTDWDERSLTVKLDFLPKGKHTMRIWKDGINANKHAADFAMTKIVVNSGDEIQIPMKKGGGYAAIISQQ